MHRLFIDGTEYTNEADGLNDTDFELTFKLDSNTKTVVYGLSNDITFSGSAYDYLYNKFVSGCNFEESVKVQIILGCCNLKELDFLINADSLEWSPINCSITAALVTDSQDAECAKQLREKIYWKDNGWRNAFDSIGGHPKVPYCRENETLQSLYFVLRILLFPILLLFERLNDILDFLGFTSNLPDIDDFNDLVSGCGRYHVSSLFKEIAEYNTSLCGLSFQSSILQNDYKNLILYHGRNKKGCETCDYREENMPAETTLTALELLNPVFKSDARIIDGTLYYETEEFYNTLYNFGQLVDVSNVSYEDEPVFSYRQSELKAYGRYEYSNDAIDTEGNQVADLYNDIVEFNPTGSKSQKDFKDVRVPFSPVRFGDDREGNTFINGRRTTRQRDMVVMQGNTCSEYKLILWDGVSPRNKVLAERRQNGSERQYNYRLFFDENYPIAELYQNYRKSDNPKDENARIIVLESFKFIPDNFCETFDLILRYGIYLEVVTPNGSGIAEEITVNFENKTVEIANVFLKCNT